MQRTRLTFWLIVAVGISACERDIPITDFKDEFGDYKPELKIEALLQQDNPGESLIRIIKSSTVIDPSLSNGRDDDGDGEVDEDDETIALVQDTSAIVSVTNLGTGEQIDFRYTSTADSAYRFDETESGNIFFQVIHYGGYKPANADFKIAPYSQFRLNVYSQDFDQRITGLMTVYPPVALIDTLFAIDENQISMRIDDEKEFFWTSDREVSAYYIMYEELEGMRDGEPFFGYRGSFASARNNDLTKAYASVSVGREVILGVEYSTVLRITVEALSPAYGRYLFSSLPLNDPQRSNLRDAAGNAVMGCFGSSAAEEIFVVIEE